MFGGHLVYDLCVHVCDVGSACLLFVICITLTSQLNGEMYLLIQSLLFGEKVCNISPQIFLTPLILWWDSHLELCLLCMSSAGWLAAIAFTCNQLLACEVSLTVTPVCKGCWSFPFFHIDSICNGFLRMNAKIGDELGCSNIICASRILFFYSLEL